MNNSIHLKCPEEILIKMWAFLRCRVLRRKKSDL